MRFFPSRVKTTTSSVGTKISPKYSLRLDSLIRFSSASRMVSSRLNATFKMYHCGAGARPSVVVLFVELLTRYPAPVHANHQPIPRVRNRRSISWLLVNLNPGPKTSCPQNLNLSDATKKLTHSKRVKQQLPNRVIAKQQQCKECHREYNNHRSSVKLTFLGP